MRVIRKNRKANYTILPNDLLRDKGLRWKDIGLLAWMLSNDDGWHFSYQSILAAHPSCGESELKGIVKRLQDRGYLRISRERGKSGKVCSTVWTVFDAPNPGTEEEETREPPQVEKLHVEKHHGVNRHYKNIRFKEDQYEEGAQLPPTQAGNSRPSNTGFVFDGAINDWRRVDG